tara:strand:+ start:45 stop:281 length:237 start_codon:yes stop_codon:yes gene_type:complete
MKIVAVNKKHQAKVNRAIYWLIKHNEANDMRDIADNNDDEKMHEKYDRICQKTFDKYEAYTSELPIREVTQIENSILY